MDLVGLVAVAAPRAGLARRQHERQHQERQQKQQQRRRRRPQAHAAVHVHLGGRRGEAAAAPAMLTLAQEATKTSQD